MAAVEAAEEGLSWLKRLSAVQREGDQQSLRLLQAKLRMRSAWLKARRAEERLMPLQVLGAEGCEREEEEGRLRCAAEELHRLCRELGVLSSDTRRSSERRWMRPLLRSARRRLIRAYWALAGMAMLRGEMATAESVAGWCFGLTRELADEKEEEGEADGEKQVEGGKDVSDRAGLMGEETRGAGVEVGEGRGEQEKGPEAGVKKDTVLIFLAAEGEGSEITGKAREEITLKSTEEIVKNLLRAEEARRVKEKKDGGVGSEDKPKSLQLEGLLMLLMPEGEDFKKWDGEVRPLGPPLPQLYVFIFLPRPCFAYFSREL